MVTVLLSLLPPKMWFFGVLVIAYGAFGVVLGTSCMYETLRCTRHRVITVPYKNFMESEEDLDKACKQQAYFYKCLDNVLRTYETENLNRLQLHPALAQAKFLNNELCSKDSRWRKKYLDVAPCVNHQSLDFCTSYDFMSINEPEGFLSNRCYLRQKAVNCIATTLTVNCDADAADMFHYLLRMTSDGVDNCDTLGSEILFPCHMFSINDTKREKMYNDMYNTLANRIGKIPEQKEGSTADPSLEQFYEVNPSVMDRVGESESKTEVITDIYDRLMDIIGNIPEQKDGTASDPLILDKFYEVVPSVMMDRVGEYVESKAEETLNDIYNKILEQKDASDPSFVHNRFYAIDPTALIDTVGEYESKTEETIANDIYSLCLLMDRIENIPEQMDDTASDPSLEQFEVVPVLLDRVGEYPESKTEETIVHAIALDSLDDNSDSEATSQHADHHETYHQRPPTIFLAPDYEDMKYGAFFRHDDGRVSVYFRKRGFIPAQSINCSYKENMTRKDFHCSVKRRLFNPLCRRNQLDSDSERPIVPKDIDPELGAELHISWPKTEYPFEQFLKSDNVVDMTQSSTNPESFEASSETSFTQDGIPVKTTEQEWTPDHTSTIGSLQDKIDVFGSYETSVSVETKEYLEPSTHYASEETSEDLDRNSGFTEPTVQSEAVTLGYFADVITAVSQTMTEGRAITTSLPDFVEDEFKSLFKLKNRDPYDRINFTPTATQNPDDWKLVNAEYEYSENGDYDIYWRDIRGESRIEAIVCGRVNECHPFAKYIFKCIFVYKRDIKNCVNCKSEVSTTPVDSEFSQADFQKETEAKVCVTGSGDYNAFFKGSSLSEYPTSSEDPVSKVCFEEASENLNELGSISRAAVDSEHAEDLVQVHGESTEQISISKSTTEELDSDVATGIQFVLIQPESEDSSDAPEMYSIEMSESIGIESATEFISENEGVAATNHPLMFTLDEIQSVEVDDLENSNVGLQQDEGIESDTEFISENGVAATNHPLMFTLDETQSVEVDDLENSNVSLQEDEGIEDIGDHLDIVQTYGPLDEYEECC